MVKWDEVCLGGKFKIPLMEINREFFKVVNENFEHLIQTHKGKELLKAVASGEYGATDLKALYYLLCSKVRLWIILIKIKSFVMLTALFFCFKPEIVA